MANRRPPLKIGLNASASIKALQPDYARWQAVTIGMSRQEVYDILGQPLIGPHSFFQPEYCHFGYLQFPLAPIFTFQIDFYSERVIRKTDPFDGVFSPDGIPSKPKINIPLENSIFSHCPEILDVRWQPVSGKYPINYDIELSIRGTVDGNPKTLIEMIPIPYHFVCFQSGIPASVRVRGRNKLGIGEWSDFRSFEFITPCQN